MALAPVMMRSRLMLEAVSELVVGSNWRDKQVMILMRKQGDDAWRTRFLASDSPEAIQLVMKGEADLAICNPGAVLGMAARGRGPFKEPLPLRSVLVLPQFDQMGFAVMANTGLKTLGDLKRARYPLKLSIRAQRDHSVHVIMNEILRAYDMTVEDIESWGGKIFYGEGMPYLPHRLGKVPSGEIDAVWDEALPLYAPQALEMGMRFLSIEEPQLKKLEESGLKRSPITEEDYPGLGETVWSIDFSGWPVYCLESASNDMIYNFCEAVDTRRDRIPWYGEGPLPLEKLCKDSKEGALYLPLHPGAERYWRERGYLP